MTTSASGPRSAACTDPLRTLRAAFLMLDSRGVVTGWSPEAERLLGYRAREVLDHSIDSIAARGKEGPQAWLAEQNAPVSYGDVTFRHASGRTVRLSAAVCRLPATVTGPVLLVSLADAEELAGWQTQQAMLHGIAAHSLVALTIYGSDLRLTWANAAARQELPGAFARYQGRSADELHPGSRVLTGQCHPSSITQVMSGVLATGQPVVGLRCRGPTFADPGREHVWSLSYYRLQDAQGRPLGVCQESVDVTDLYDAQQRLALLNEASVVIGSTLDLDRTVQELAEVLVPRVADFTAIDLLGDVLDGRELATQSMSRTSDMRRVVQRSVREDLPEAVVTPGQAVGYPEGCPQWECLADSRPVLNAVLDRSSPWLIQDPVRSGRMDRLGIHSHLVVPLGARGVTMGVVTLMRWRNPDPFTAEDLLLVEELAARAAVCVDNARRFGREHHSALTLQRSLLPHQLPAHAAVEAAYRYLPADIEAGVGGDWFDVLPLACARVGLVVGDVIGHGLNAAATMGRLRTAVHTLADLDLPPDELLSHLDDLVRRLSDEAETAHPSDIEGVVGATCLYGIYDPVAQRATFARAGHPPPALAHLDKPVEYLDIPAGPPLGVGGLPFEAVEVDIPEGSMLALYTDGLLTAFGNDTDAGLERLAFSLAHPDRPLEDICETMEETLLPDRPRDDVAILVARPCPLAAEDVAFWTLSFDPASVGRARVLATERLALWELEELAFSMELIISELVTNAIRHARGPIGLRLIRTGNRVICAVLDASSTAPHLRRAGLAEEGGRGLFLVAQFALRWGARYTRDGKIIWAELPIPVPETGVPGR